MLFTDTQVFVDQEQAFVYRGKNFCGFLARPLNDHIAFAQLPYKVEHDDKEVNNRKADTNGLNPAQARGLGRGQMFQCNGEIVHMT